VLLVYEERTRNEKRNRQRLSWTNPLDTHLLLQMLLPSPLLSPAASASPSRPRAQAHTGARHRTQAAGVSQGLCQVSSSGPIFLSRHELKQCWLAPDTLRQSLLSHQSLTEKTINLFFFWYY